MFKYISFCIILTYSFEAWQGFDNFDVLYLAIGLLRFITFSLPHRRLYLQGLNSFFTGMYFLFNFGRRFLYFSNFDFKTK